MRPLLALLLALLILSPVAEARGHGGGSRSSSSSTYRAKPVQVRTYVKRNGEVVQSHRRALPRK